MSAPYTEDQFTDWFPPHVKPARPGVYRVRLLDHDEEDGRVISEGFARFDGYLWSDIAYSADAAAVRATSLACFQNKPWCGLNFDPAQLVPESAKTALQQFAESIEFSGPDDDGLFWMAAGAPGGLKVGVNLGPEQGIVARAAAQLEQLRVKALMECKR